MTRTGVDQRARAGRASQLDAMNLEPGSRGGGWAIGASVELEIDVQAMKA